MCCGSKEALDLLLQGRVNSLHHARQLFHGELSVCILIPHSEKPLRFSCAETTSSTKLSCRKLSIAIYVQGLEKGLQVLPFEAFETGHRFPATGGHTHRILNAAPEEPGLTHRSPLLSQQGRQNLVGVEASAPASTTFNSGVASFGPEQAQEIPQGDLAFCYLPRFIQASNTLLQTVREIHSQKALTDVHDEPRSCKLVGIIREVEGHQLAVFDSRVDHRKDFDPALTYQLKQLRGVDDLGILLAGKKSKSNPSDPGMRLGETVPIGSPLPGFPVLPLRPRLRGAARWGSTRSKPQLPPRSRTGLRCCTPNCLGGGGRTQEMHGFLEDVLVVGGERLAKPKQALTAVGIVHKFTNAHVSGAICVKALEHLLRKLIHAPAVRQTRFGKKPRQTIKNRADS
mmetsp:Transcript_9406/g.22607  ORF Transcript_9406/g.22607 Transcript_9406/m.22607 type:complete len:399 (-) Transcript_9406:415-1611(-)